MYKVSKKIIFFALVLAGLFCQTALASKPLIREIPPVERIMSDKISVSQKIDGERSIVTFRSSLPLEVESYMMPQIQRYVVDIFNLSDNADAEISITGKAPVKRVVRQSKEFNGARVSRVILDLSGEYSVKSSVEKEGRELLLFITPVKKVLPSPAITATVGKTSKRLEPVIPAKTATSFRGISAVELHPKGVFVKTEGEPEITNHFRLQEPDRIVIDLQPVKLAVKEETILKKHGVSRVRVKNDGARTRVVLDLLPGAVGGYGISVNKSGFLVETGKMR